MERYCPNKQMEVPKKIAETDCLKEKFCKVCQVALTSQSMATVHMMGKKHRKKAALVSESVGNAVEARKEAPIKEDDDNDDLKDLLKSVSGEEGMDGTWGE